MNSNFSWNWGRCQVQSFNPIRLGYHSLNDTFPEIYWHWHQFNKFNCENCISWSKIWLCKHIWMEHYDLKVFTCVLWQFTTKFATLTRVFGFAMCKQGQYTWNRVDTPENWHTILFLVGLGNPLSGKHHSATVLWY